jgi:hypothetical protein
VHAPFVAGELERISYEESLRSLDKQEAVLGEIRSRAGLLLAASSLSASFLGEPALDRGSTVLGVAALVAFGLSLVASVYILLPKRNLVFSLAGPRVFEELYEFKGNAAEVHRRLAYDLHRFWEQNDEKLQRLFRAFWLAALFLGLEVVLLLISFAGTLG